MTSIEQSAAAMARYVAELEKEVQALRADALRYRWLRDVADRDDDECPYIAFDRMDFDGLDGDMEQPPEIFTAWLTGDKADAAIDAAMGGREGK